ncbi:MAG TPA: peptidase S10 [Planctomycetota bacterium]|nr:peptidase S10 [Planctomycetota bacterium]
MQLQLHRFTWPSVLLTLAGSLAAQEPKPATPPPAAPAAAPVHTEPKSFVTEHRIEVDGRPLEYTATAGETLLRDDDGSERASFFTFSYTVKGGDPARRPLTFAFNGGPGSSSVWLHFGLIGPLRVRVPSDGRSAGVPPYQLEANACTLLTVSDLVLVDPIGTGFSRALGKAKGEDFWGVAEDARSVAEFIRRYLTENKRWSSPKYLLGESYGGIRSALLLSELQGGLAAVAINGAMLISPAFDLQFVDGSGSDLQIALLVPTLAATALYHHALPEEPKDAAAFLQQARAFAGGEYLTALFAGAGLAPERLTSVVAQLHRFTGLSEDYLRRTNLRVSAARFRRELLRARGLVVGRLDARYTGTEADDAGEVPTGDPMAPAISGAYVATFEDYLALELGVHMERNYEVISGRAGGAWKRSPGLNHSFAGWLDVMPDLVRAQADNTQLRLFIASGLYDTATTFFAAEYQARRYGMDQQRVTVRSYPSGHMVYLHEPSLQQLAGDLRAFVQPAK